MTSDQGFKLHPEAARDITDIWEYIAAENPLAAGRVREEILDAIRKLVPFPHQGHKRPDLTSLPLRYQIVRNYIIAYAPEEKPLLRWLNRNDHAMLVAAKDGIEPPTPIFQSTTIHHRTEYCCLILSYRVRSHYYGFTTPQHTHIHCQLPSRTRGAG